MRKAAAKVRINEQNTKFLFEFFRFDASQTTLAESNHILGLASHESAYVADSYIQ